MIEQQLKKWKESPTSILGAILGALFFLWMIMGSFPTGWIYDLAAGTGTAPGQKPDGSVVWVTAQGDLQKLCVSETPVTVNSSTFIASPLMRLRDSSEAGIHKTNRSTGYQNVEVKEYHRFDYPITGRQKLIKSLVLAASYNNYYLAQLEDGTYVGVFFDDYQMITKQSGKELSLPAGELRYGTGEERRMLNKMAADYEVNTFYILDMYHHGRVWWGLDKLLRLGIAMGILFVGILLKERLVGGKAKGKEIEKGEMDHVSP